MLAHDSGPIISLNELACKMFTIKIKDFYIHTIIGIYNWEKDPQEILINATIYLSEDAGNIDDISSSLDYDKAVDIIRKTCNHPHNLLESLAKNIAHNLRQEQFVQKAEIELTKINIGKGEYQISVSYI